MDSTQRGSRVHLAVRMAMREIRKDVAEGTVPASVGSFAELHDYVDANVYGGLCDGTWEFDSDGLDDANRVQDTLDRWIKSRPFAWTSGPVDLGYGGEFGVWLAEYQPSSRWNGWIAAPYFDALSIVDILTTVVNGPDADPYHGIDWHFEDDGTLVMEDRQWREEDPEGFEVERQTPTEDGLYSLGAFGWTWDECETDDEEDD